ncbi:NADPH-dependent F420 reductase [Variovorax sp. JS1663]|uniref:NADPH-dependent F420 reductase n=1 Tax=Variovorax sp. JS1663 TaxID=1851577 RepID=UPI000B3473A8|nr:NADPH-dependent F420 reductase [Variovorax sp. JS1663]OUM00014.1 NADP oxidoreductase [Variovorax sp. JS1663]
MKIGIIGTGNIGSAIARAMVRIGQDVTLANRRGPAALDGLLEELGAKARAGTVEEAAKADIVFVAVNWSKIPEALAGLENWSGRIVVDANNPIEAPAFRSFDLGGRSSSEVFSDFVPGAKVVKAFNHLQPHLLSGDPRAEGGQRVLFLAGDDAQAKANVSQLISRLGFAAVDLGSLAQGGRLTQFPGGPLPTLNLVKFD